MALFGHPLLFFVLCLSICPRPVPGQFPDSSWPALGQPAAIYSRVGNSSAQTVGAQAFRTLDFRLFEHKIAIFVLGKKGIGIGKNKYGLPANHRAHL